MPVLKCGVIKCTYYYNNRCAKSIIKVEGKDATRELDTNCASFYKRDRTATDNYNLEIATIDDILSDYLSVNCEVVNCLYNHNQICRAKEIKIDGTKAKRDEDTFCSSFVNK